MNIGTKRLSQAAIDSLLRARRRDRASMNNGSVPPGAFRDYRTIQRLLDMNIIELWKGYGSVMYRMTKDGNEILDRIQAGKAKI